MNIFAAQKNVSSVQQNFFNKVLGFFALALLVSAGGVFFGLQAIPLKILINPVFYFSAFAIELVLIFTARRWSRNLPLGYYLFIFFAFLTGVTAIPILALAGSVGGTALIGKALLATVATFLGAAIIGTTTKKNLSSLGGVLTMSLMGMIVISVIGIFLPWGSTFELIFAGFGVIIFSVYTAYDFQKIRRQAHAPDAAMMVAIRLYLDIFNLFLFILRFMIALRD